MTFNRTTYCPKYDYAMLRGRIRQICKTEQKFAELIGRTQNFLTKVFQGRSYFDTKDIYRAIEVLDIPCNEIGIYFYTLKVCENETA